jgi:hypothetical protein
MVALRGHDVLLHDRFDAVGDPHQEPLRSSPVRADARLHARGHAALDPGDDPRRRGHEQEDDRRGDAEHDESREQIGRHARAEAVDADLADHRRLGAALDPDARQPIVARGDEVPLAHDLHALEAHDQIVREHLSLVGGAGGAHLADHEPAGGRRVGGQGDAQEREETIGLPLARRDHRAPRRRRPEVDGHPLDRAGDRLALGARRRERDHHVPEERGVLGVVALPAEARLQALGEDHRDLSVRHAGALDLDHLITLDRLPGPAQLGRLEGDGRLLRVGSRREVDAQHLDAIPDVDLTRDHVEELEHLGRGAVAGAAGEAQQDDEDAEQPADQEARCPG